MPRQRTKLENKGLPKRWRFLHGAYYYAVPEGSRPHWDGKALFRLGKSLPEAYREWAKRISVREQERTIDALLDKYAAEVVPTKPPKQQREDARYIKKLKLAFGPLLLAEIQPHLVKQFYNEAMRKTAAKRALAVLSHAFTVAVEDWGYLAAHPFAGEVRLKNNPPRGRYVADWEIIEALRLQPERRKGSVLAVQALIRLTLLTGMRRGDALRLRLTDLHDDGIHVQPGKTRDTTGKAVIYTWTAALRDAVRLAKDARPMTTSSWLFCNKHGACYYDEEKGTASGWDSMWQRYMMRLLAETQLKEPFTQHDLRAKCASDAPSLEHAQKLLAHADGRTTQRFYRRNGERVAPLQ